MAGFGHVMKIFIGAGFPRMGFPGYIVCLYVVACDNVYFSLIIILMFLAFNLTHISIDASDMAIGGVLGQKTRTSTLCHLFY